MKTEVTGIEDVAAILGAWQAELIQLELPAVGTHASCLTLPSHRILRLQAGSAFAVRGHAQQAGVLASVIPRSAVRHLGRPLQPGDLLALGQGARIELLVPRGAALVLLLPDRQDWIDRLALRRFEGYTTFSALPLFRTIVDPDARCPLTRPLLDELLRQVVKASRDASRDRRINQRVAATLSGCRFVERRFPAVVRLAELARHCGVAQRTLEYGFRQVYDTTPLGFIRSLRLTRSRNALLHAAATTSISQTARACGFAHMGQYSQDYRRLFGETPSMTLARQRRRDAGKATLGS